jgi:hypothetical protein
MYHAYEHGFSTLPDLKKIKTEEIFEKNKSDCFELHKEKKEALDNQEYFFEHDVTEEIYNTCFNFIKLNYPVETKSGDYLSLAKEIDEDLIIQRLDDKQDWMASAHVCFPSGWLPSEKIGKNFDEIHAPVPMSLHNSKKIVEAMIYKGIFERFVWSVVHEKKYNFHPRFKTKEFDASNPCVFIKIERQVTVAFPEQHFCLFILRQYLIDEKNIKKEALCSSLMKMKEPELKYKGIKSKEELIKYLTSYV